MRVTIGNITYCCYGMYTDVGHSDNCQTLKPKVVLPEPVPLLSAEGAQRAARSVYRAEDEDALLAIATERAKVCKVMTEAELRKEFDVFYTAKIDAGGHMLYEDGLCGYLALARHLGLVAENTETGS